MKSYILRYGAIGALLMIVLALVNWFIFAPNFGVGISQLFGYLGIILSLLCIPLGLKHFKNVINSGVMSFGQGFKIGTLITLVVSIIMFIYGMLFFVFQGDEFREWQFKGLEGEELEMMQNQMDAMPEMAMTPWFQGIIMFLLVFTIGFVVTLLSAFILKSKGAAATSA